MAADSPRFFASFAQKIAGIILILLLVSLIALVFSWYSTSITRVDDNYINHQNLTDQVLKQSIVWIDRGISLYEGQFVPDLKTAMEINQQEYNKTGGNTSKLNLTEIKTRIAHELGNDYDLYLIDTEGVVIKTTFKDDIGLDFKKYPEFFKEITETRLNKTFIPDRTVKGFAPGAPFRKFAYMGTRDGEYLLEISRRFDKLLPGSSGASYKELIHSLPKINPYIISTELYNSRYEVVSHFSPNGTQVTPNPDIVSELIRVFQSKEDNFRIDPVSGDHIRYTFLPVSEIQAPSAREMHLIARTAYSNEKIEQEKVELTIILFIFLLVTALIAYIGAKAGSRYLSRPINQIVEDIEIIAAGDLDHPVRDSGSSEFRHIENSVNLLVRNLKGNISDLKNREEELLEELAKRWRAEENYRRLFESAHDAILILERNTIIQCNFAATELCGRDADRVTGREIHEISPSRQPDGSHSDQKFLEIISQVIKEERDSCEWVFIRPDGSSVITEAHMSAVFSDEVILIMGIFRDVTNLREMEQREALAVSQIEENLVQLAAINDQIRNPLSVIAVLNELEGGDHEEKIHDQIRVIDSLINEVDRRFVSTDKVRLFLTKHYGINDTRNNEPDKEGQR